MELFDTFPEKVICESLLSWVNDGSHCINDDLYIQKNEEDTKIYKKVFKDIFGKAGHLSHYRMMMGEEKNKEE